MSGKSIAVSVLLAASAAGASTVATDRRDFKELAARTAASEEISKPGSKCPISKELVGTLDLNVLSICTAYGLTAMDAARRYPEVATKVFALYGEDPLFQAVFDRYGQMVVPVVGYFVENGSNRYRFNARLSGALQQVFQGQTPTWGDAPSGEQMGFMAVQELDERGAEVLAEFEVSDGHARRKSVEATVLGIKNLILGGIQKLETVSARGNTPTWKDYAGAGLDVAVVAGGVGVLAKEARIAEAAVGRTSARAVATEASGILGDVGKIAVGPVGTVAVLYVALAHPSLVSSAVGWAAEQLGLNGTACILIAYLLLFEILYWILKPMLWLVWRPLWLAVRFFSRTAKNGQAWRGVSSFLSATGGPILRLATPNGSDMRSMPDSGQMAARKEVAH